MKRQVFDLSTLIIQVTEYPALIKVCPNCHYKNEGQFPKHVTQPTQYGPHLTMCIILFESLSIDSFQPCETINSRYFRSDNHPRNTSKYDETIL